MINIPDGEVEKALDFLRDSAAEMGEAVAQQTKCHAMLRHTKAIAMKASGESSAAAQEREAYASPEYLEAIQAEFNAVREASKLRALREAAAAKLDCWRSESANNRASRI